MNTLEEEEEIHTISDCVELAELVCRVSFEDGKENIYQGVLFYPLGYYRYFSA